jgi:hypothetical protein
MHLRYHVAFDEEHSVVYPSSDRRHGCLHGTASLGPPRTLRRYRGCYAEHQLRSPRGAWPSLAISHMEASSPTTILLPCCCILTAPSHWRMSLVLTLHSPCTCPRRRPCRARYEQKIRRERPLGRTYSLAPPWLLTSRLQLGLISPASPPQNLAIKTPSPRPHLHRKKKHFWLGTCVASTSDGY